MSLISFVGVLSVWGTLVIWKHETFSSVIRYLCWSNRCIACPCLYCFTDCECNRYARKDVPFGKEADGYIKE